MSSELQPTTTSCKLLSPNYFKLVPPSGFQQPQTAAAGHSGPPSGSAGAENDTVARVECVSPHCIGQVDESQLLSSDGDQQWDITSAKEQHGRPPPLTDNVDREPVRVSTNSSSTPAHVKGHDPATKVVSQPTHTNVLSRQSRLRKNESSRREVHVAPKVMKLSSNKHEGRPTAVTVAEQPLAKVVNEAETVPTSAKTMVVLSKTDGKNDTQVLSAVREEGNVCSSAASGDNDATTFNLQYDNYFKYAAGRCAIATTKQQWEYADSEGESGEPGEVLLHRSLASKLERADKHLRYFNSCTDPPPPTITRGHLQTHPQLTTPTPVQTETGKSSSETSSLSVNTVPEGSVGVTRVVTDSGSVVTTGAECLEEPGLKRSLSFAEWSLNDLSVEDSPLSSCCVEPFHSRPEEIPNTYEIELLSSQAVRQPETSASPSHQPGTRPGSTHTTATVTRPGSTHTQLQGTTRAMASGGVQMDTKSDFMLAQILQSEEESRSGCTTRGGYVSHRGRGRGREHHSSDFEIARQLQQELDEETAQQLQHQEERQQGHGRTQDHRHHDSHPHGDTRDADVAHFDNNGQFHVRRPYERRGDHMSQRGDHMSRGYRPHRGGHEHMVGTVVAVPPLFYPGHHHHHHQAEEEEMDMSYEALSELEDVSRGLDRSTIHRLTNLHDYVPSKDSTTTSSGPSSVDPSSTSGKSCSICLSEFARGDLLRSLPCFHSFHRECIDRWLTTNKQCPVCLVELLQPNS